MIKKIVPKERLYSPSDFNEGMKIKIELLYHSPRERIEIREGIVLNPLAEEDKTLAHSRFGEKVLEMRVNESFKGNPRQMPRRYNYWRITIAYKID